MTNEYSDDLKVYLEDFKKQFQNCFHELLKKENHKSISNYNEEIIHHARYCNNFAIASDTIKTETFVINIYFFVKTLVIVFIHKQWHGFLNLINGFQNKDLSLLF